MIDKNRRAKYIFLLEWITEDHQNSTFAARRIKIAVAVVVVVIVGLVGSWFRRRSRNAARDRLCCCCDYSLFL